jgi:excisionase family DNA binding protein
MLTAKQRRAFGLGEVAEFYGVSKDSIKRLAIAGVVRTIMLGGRKLIPLSELERIDQKGLPLPSGRQRKAR